jgi:hypothetical protein
MADAGPRTESLATIASGLAGDIQDLVRGELTLARVEIDRSIRGLIIGLLSAVGGGLVAFAGLVVLLEGIAAALARSLPTWAALLIVGAVIVLVGGLLAYGGISKLSLRGMAPERTTENVKKDARVVQEHV